MLSPLAVRARKKFGANGSDQTAPVHSTSSGLTEPAAFGGGAIPATYNRVPRTARCWMAEFQAENGPWGSALQNEPFHCARFVALSEPARSKRPPTYRLNPSSAIAVTQPGES